MLLLLLLLFSLLEAAKFAQSQEFDAFLAVGGGSVMDTAKAANLLSCHPHKQLLDFVNAPIGKAEQPTCPLKPLIAGELTIYPPDGTINQEYIHHSTLFYTNYLYIRIYFLCPCVCVCTPPKRLDWFGWNFLCVINMIREWFRFTMLSYRKCSFN